MKYVPTDPDEARWREQELAAKYAAKNGHPDPADKVAYAAWLKTPLPKDRRRAAVYLHATFGEICGICLTPIDIDLLRPHPGAAQVDHISPKAWFGEDVWGNVRVVHAYCNGYRSDIPGQGYGEPNPVKAAEGLERAIRWFFDPIARANPGLVRSVYRLETQKQLLYEYREENGIPHPEGRHGEPGNPEIWREWFIDEPADEDPSAATAVVEL